MCAGLISQNGRDLGVAVKTDYTSHVHSTSLRLISADKPQVLNLTDALKCYMKLLFTYITKCPQSGAGHVPFTSAPIITM